MAPWLLKNLDNMVQIMVNVDTLRLRPDLANSRMIVREVVLDHLRAESSVTSTTDNGLKRTTFSREVPVA